MRLPKKLPIDTGELRELLTKSKNKESQLMAELAIREYPEFEAAIQGIVLRMIEAARSDTQAKMARPSTGKGAIRAEQLTRQIQMLTAQLKSTREVLSEILGDVPVKRMERLQNQRDSSALALKSELASWDDVFLEAELDIYELLPELSRVLGPRCRKSPTP